MVKDTKKHAGTTIPVTEERNRMEAVTMGSRAVRGRPDIIATKTEARAVKKF